MKIKNIISVLAGLGFALLPAFAGSVSQTHNFPQTVKNTSSYDLATAEDRRDICEDIYETRLLTSDCSHLDSEYIADIQHVYESLKNPIGHYNDRNDEFYYGLPLFLAVSPRPFVELIKNYNQSEAKTVLKWIAKNKDVTKALYEADNNFRILNSLFESAGLRNFKGWHAQNIVPGGNGLFDIIVKNDNEEAFNYVHSFLMSNPACSNNHELCFINYCKAIDSFNFKITNRDTISSLLDFENLENYIDGIIANKINKVNWRYQDLEDSSDLNNDWWGDICSRKQSEIIEIEGHAEKLVEEVGVEKAKEALQNLLIEEKLNVIVEKFVTEYEQERGIRFLEEIEEGEE